MIGNDGLTDAVIAETDRALGAHGLIKVRIFGDDRDARQSMATELEARSGAALVQAIGKLVVLWRPRAEDDGPIGAAPAPTPAARRRPTLSVPKKLAAEGKPAPKRRARTGMPRPPAEDAPPRRSRAPAGRPVGPGLRGARGALDPSVARAASGGASSGIRGGRPAGASATRGTASTGARGAGARPTAGTGSPAAGARPAGTRPEGGRPAGARPAGARPAGARPAGARPAGAARGPGSFDPRSDGSPAPRPAGRPS
ncbi:MAG: YhbY family RNA-binding protein, partial [Burkholderiaceae bacterium]|nr:YhbY family RNA-binding protein [Burkholderiaceae bacterium]